MHCILHIDGGARGNPGPAGVGIVLADDDGTPLHEAGYFLGKTTNNVAEYHGLLRGIECARKLGADRLTIRSDSELMVRQLHGEYRVKAAALKPLFQEAKENLATFGEWSIEHVYREQNTRADELANAAMDAGADIVEMDGSAFTAAKPGRKQSKKKDNTPRWTLTLEDGASGCIANQQPGDTFTFDTTTPAGCCVHAAAAALADGPLQWPAKKPSGDTRCAECDMRISMKRCQ